MELWIKSLHILSIIAWMAGMLYLPRLFVYHCGVAVGSEASETFKIMERRLLKAIINPAMIVSWIAGLWLAWNGHFFVAHWMSAKFVLVILMSAVHGYLAKTVRVFAEDKNDKTAIFYRVLNEVPTVLLILIVILVVVKPF
jgi:protoporphyrinogen IX oxidase